MEHDDRHLDAFSSSTIGYFNEVLIKKNCVISTFRKYSIKNDEDDEFIFLLRSTCGDKLFYLTDSSFLTEETIRVTSDETEISDLTSLRVNLVKRAVMNLLLVGGYKLRDEGEDGRIHFTRKNSSDEGETGTLVKVLCGPVVNSATKMKETQITPAEYRKLRLKYLEATSSKTSDPQLLESLVDSIITISLLQVKSSQAVSINLSEDVKESDSKGNAFLQYNASRLAAIRHKYGERVKEEVYPRTPKPEEVDFALLKEPEEWALVFNFLLEYPSLIERVSKAMLTGKSNVHQICDFLSKLCSMFSIYYRRVRILLEPKDHLLQTIQARVLFAMSVEQVLENGLAILNIKKIERM